MYVLCQVFSNLFFSRTYFFIHHVYRTSENQKKTRLRQSRLDLRNCLRYSEQTHLIAKDHDVPTKSRIQNKKVKLFTFSVIPRQCRQILYKSVFYKISAENKQNIELILY